MCGHCVREGLEATRGGGGGSVCKALVQTSEVSSYSGNRAGRPRRHGLSVCMRCPSAARVRSAKWRHRLPPELAQAVPSAWLWDGGREELLSFVEKLGRFPSPTQAYQRQLPETLICVCSLPA